ncbi:MAG: hypothetical protein M3Q56_08995 [Bacteroidota bacterium]|nr:hypothetical protein [Bacteroidota bacterium]
MKLFLTLILLCFIVSDSNSKVVGKVINTIEDAKSIGVENDSLSIFKTVNKFLQWYKVNYKVANAFKFTFTDSKGNYQVNMKECNKYLAYLQSSLFISDTYVQEWKKYFEMKVEYFAAYPMKEGPPEGFDVDLILMTQEPELVLNNIKNLPMKIAELTPDKAILHIEADYGYEIDLSRVSGKWKIDYISPLNDDLNLNK